MQTAIGLITNAWTNHNLRQPKKKKKKQSFWLTTTIQVKSS